MLFGKLRDQVNCFVEVVIAFAFDPSAELELGVPSDAYNLAYNAHLSKISPPY